MNVEMVVRNVRIILAPVVLITACAVLVQGILGRYAAINDRLRATAHERLDLLYGRVESAELRREHLQIVDTQIPLVLRQHRLIQHALLALYTAEVIFTASMFLIAGAALLAATETATIALALFMLGAGALRVGVLLAVEIRTSHQALHYEVQRVADLKP